MTTKIIDEIQAAALRARAEADEAQAAYLAALKKEKDTASAAAEATDARYRAWQRREETRRHAEATAQAVADGERRAARVAP